MNEAQRQWMRRNVPLIVVIGFAVVALLYLGDDIVKKRSERISIQPILPEVERTDPRQGTEDPTVTVIEFGDFNCIACKEQVAIMKDIINDYGEYVQWAWKDAPLDALDPESRTASIVAHCAGNQNKFWEMHDLLFERQQDLGSELYPELAESLELDTQLFNQCVASRETQSLVDHNIEAATLAQVGATPTFFINGERYEGLMEYAELVNAFATAQ